MKKLFFDLETTGVKVGIHGIHQIACMVEIDGQVVDQFDLKVKPFPGAVMDPKALEVGGVTEQDLEGYKEIKKGFNFVKNKLGKYVDRFDRSDKMYLVGFNNRAFDDRFFRAWFEYNDDPYFGAWFWSDSLDVMVLASEYLIERRQQMPNFKLKTVAKELGIVVDESRLHDGVYDIEITREVYRIVTGKTFEL